MARITLDDLAASIQNEFSSLHDQIDGLEQKVGGLEAGVSSLGQKVANLEQGQERIFLRLDHLAPHFEVKDLGERVKTLEIDVKILNSASH
ncbi:MAG: hypothetical protein WCG48_02000 [Candidatus Berkelbacteria bacterium]